MPQVRLNGWQRIGIVLSVLWCVLIIAFAVMVRLKTDTAEAININDCSYNVEPFYDWYDAKSGMALEKRTEQIMPLKYKQDPQGAISCEDIRTTVDENFFTGNIDPVLHPRYWEITAFVLVPVALFWLLAYLLVYTVKWVVMGFRTAK